MRGGDGDPGGSARGARVRLDKWLWAARFFKTRSLAAAAIEGGKIEVGGERAKRSRLVGPGDALRVRQGPFEHHVIVKAVAERRGPASDAARLYEETEASRLARQKTAEHLRDFASGEWHGKGRPTKKDRRNLGRLRDG